MSIPILASAASLAATGPVALYDVAPPPELFIGLGVVAFIGLILFLGVIFLVLYFTVIRKPKKPVA
jgi:uncharacterized BrkB/YihY/UPF0761 family membrane protein